MLKNIMRLLISLAIISCFFSCSKNLIYVAAQQENLQKENGTALLFRLDSLSKTTPKTFYSKLSVDYADSSQEISFKTSVKIRTDSATQLIVSYLNIPIVLANVSPDSIILVDKKEKCYSVKPLDYFNELLGIDLSLLNLEELLLGKPLYFNALHSHTLQSKTPMLVLSTTIIRQNKKDSILVNYIFNPSENQLVGVEVIIPSEEISLNVTHLSHQLVNGIHVPYESKIVVETKLNLINLRIRYEKVEINNPLEFNFVIPENYATCN